MSIVFKIVAKPHLEAKDLLDSSKVIAMGSRFFMAARHALDRGNLVQKIFDRFPNQPNFPLYHQALIYNSQIVRTLRGAKHFLHELRQFDKAFFDYTTAHSIKKDKEHRFENRLFFARFVLALFLDRLAYTEIARINALFTAKHRRALLHTHMLFLENLARRTYRETKELHISEVKQKWLARKLQFNDKLYLQLLLGHAQHIFGQALGPKEVGYFLLRAREFALADYLKYLEKELTTPKKLTVNFLTQEQDLKRSWIKQLYQELHSYAKEAIFHNKNRNVLIINTEAFYDAKDLLAKSEAFFAKKSLASRKVLFFHQAETPLHSFEHLKEQEKIHKKITKVAKHLPLKQEEVLFASFSPKPKKQVYFALVEIAKNLEVIDVKEPVQAMTAFQEPTNSLHHVREQNVQHQRIAERQKVVIEEKRLGDEIAASSPLDSLPKETAAMAGKIEVPETKLAPLAYAPLPLPTESVVQSLGDIRRLFKQK